MSVVTSACRNAVPTSQKDIAQEVDNEVRINNLTMTSKGVEAYVSSKSATSSVNPLQTSLGLAESPFHLCTHLVETAVFTVSGGRDEVKTSENTSKVFMEDISFCIPSVSASTG